MRDNLEQRERELEAIISTLEKEIECLRAALNGILLQWDKPNRDPTREQLGVAVLVHANSCPLRTLCCKNMLHCADNADRSEFVRCILSPELPEGLGLVLRGPAFCPSAWRCRRHHP
jgi:hypothetical protein